MKKLPIGIQTFREIRNSNYIYVDKTGLAARLVSDYKYAFLSRPRRFGKSLLVDTLFEMFSGNRELFAGLAAEKEHDWSRSFPVIKISFGGGNYSTLTKTEETFARNLAQNEQELGVTTSSSDETSRFDELISATAQKYGTQVVILIDEYDNPLLDNIAHPERLQEMRNLLRSFYSVIKDMDRLLRFVFLTGVSRFSRVSLFSGLNNLKDISLLPAYSAICGYTDQELQTSFADRLEGVDTAKLKQWYDGYNFLGENVYNPFDILQFFDEGTYRSYWFETGTPSFLISMIRKYRYFVPKLSSVTVSEKVLTRFDVERLDLLTLMYQSGYLTIKKLEEIGPLRRFTLGFPNLEVAAAFAESLMDLFEFDSADSSALTSSAALALINEDMELFHKTLISLFASIPHHNYTGNEIEVYEGYYASIVFVWLSATGLRVHAENPTNKGRIDLTIELEKAVYVVEFKVDQPGKALAQIKERGYAEKFMASGKRVYLIGINFDSEARGVEEFVWERG